MGATASRHPPIGIRALRQLDYLDTITAGVDVTRQYLGSGQYRWAVTFMDRGDDFDIESPISRNYLNDSSGTTPSVTATKVKRSDGARSSRQRERWLRKIFAIEPVQTPSRAVP